MLSRDSRLYVRNPEKEFSEKINKKEEPSVSPHLTRKPACKIWTLNKVLY